MNAPKLRNGLTPKQDKFTTIVLKQLKETGTINGTQAVMQSYNTENPKSAGVIASDNLNLPSVKEKIDKAMETSGLTPSLIMDNLKDLAVREVEKVSADVKLKTNIELLKLMGAYPGSKHTSVNLNIKGTVKDMSHSQVKEELKVIDNELNELLEEPNNPTTKE